MKRPLWKRSGYIVVHGLLRLGCLLMFRLRCHGREKVPPTGAILICSNHQSYLDPMLLGVCFNEGLNYLARKSLFNSPIFGWAIAYLDAIPINRDGMSLEGIKETLRRLKRGERVLMFPEGTRSEDGSLGEIKPGICALARRGKAAILPMAVDGAYDAWPRRVKLPRSVTVTVTIGELIPANEVAQLSDEQLVAELQQRIATSFAEAKQIRHTYDRVP
jgi:1-acyl-sn-glycerol-3-phosphate acyltransferase